jgi:hypothetical protein
MRNPPTHEVVAAAQLKRPADNFFGSSRVDPKALRHNGRARISTTSLQRS